MARDVLAGYHPGMGGENAIERPRRIGFRRILRRLATTLCVLLIAAGAFALFGGLEWLARKQLESVLWGRIDAPDMDAGLTLVRLENGRLWERGHPDHCQIFAREAEGDIDLSELWCPRVRIRGGVLSYRETIDTAFVKPVTTRFPRFELEDTTVKLGGETILHADRAILDRDDARLYSFEGEGVTHRRVRIDRIALRLREHGDGVDVPGVSARLMGGHMVASVTVRGDGAFTGQGRATDLDLEAILATLGPPVDFGVSGRVDVVFSASGRADDLAAARGSGSFLVRDLRLAGDPDAKSLLGVLLGADPDAGPFDSARGRIEFADGVVRIVQAEVLGPRWSLEATGSVDIIREEVDVEVVLRDRRRRLADIALVGPALQWLADGMRETFARARIKGPFQEARIYPGVFEQLWRGVIAEVEARLR